MKWYKFKPIYLKNQIKWTIFQVLPNDSRINRNFEINQQLKKSYVRNEQNPQIVKLYRKESQTFKEHVIPVLSKQLPKVVRDKSPNSLK